MKSEKKNKGKMVKVIYFDEIAARDFIDIENGGQLDWSSEENKKKVAEIVLELEAKSKGGFNILSLLKASIEGGGNAKLDLNNSNILDSTLKNTLLTDYIKLALENENIIRRFDNDGVHAPKDSVSMYKMFSSYLDIVPKEELPIDMKKLNDALLGERGYYEMLLNSENVPKSVLRFNIKAFNNNYNLADLSKMTLTYFGVKVGTCKIEQLTMEKEFEVGDQKMMDASDIVESKSTLDKQDSKALDVYDIVLAGVMSE